MTEIAAIILILLLVFEKNISKILERLFVTKKNTFPPLSTYKIQTIIHDVDYTNKKVWGTFGGNIQNIHPDDSNDVKSSLSKHPSRFHRTIFCCPIYNYKDNFIKIYDNWGSFRVKNKSFGIIHKIPIYDFGDTVRLIEKPDKVRKIVQISTHSYSKIDDIVYHVEVEKGNYWSYYWFYNQIMEA